MIFPFINLQLKINFSCYALLETSRRNFRNLFQVLPSASDVFLLKHKEIALPAFDVLPRMMRREDVHGEFDVAALSPVCRCCTSTDFDRQLTMASSPRERVSE